MSLAAFPYKIAVLVFLENTAGAQLLLLRAKPPNLGNWSPIGGKLELATGESPFECAVRETFEETGFRVEVKDLHLFAMIAEKAYEGQSHWLLFLFRCLKPIPALPADIDEGRFGFSPAKNSSGSRCLKQIARRCGPFSIDTRISSSRCAPIVRRANPWTSRSSRWCPTRVQELPRTASHERAVPCSRAQD